MNNDTAEYSDATETDSVCERKVNISSDNSAVLTTDVTGKAMLMLYTY